MKRAILLVLMLALIAVPASAVSKELIQIGISGALSSPEIVTDVLSGSEESIIVGTSSGVFLFTDDGELELFLQTASAITNVVVVDDLSGDGRKDLVVTLADRYFPNVRAIDSSNGEWLWEFSPTTEVCDPFVLWTQQQVLVQDISLLQDLTGDGFQEIVFTAGYNVYALDGNTGEQLWLFEDSDNTWDLLVVEDQNGDSVKDITVGDQNGDLHLLSGSEGAIIWKTKLAEIYSVIDPSKNSAVGEVRRSIWDIVPLGEDIAVSAEDGFVRKISLQTGDVVWEHEVIEYVDSQLYQYYGDNPLPTGIGRYCFFNLRLTLVDDISGDGVEDVIASTYPGPRAQSDFSGTQGLYMLDSSTGDEMWKNQNVVLTRAPSLGVAELRGENYLLIPTGSTGGKEKVQLLEPSTGNVFTTLAVNASSRPISTGIYSTKPFGGRNRFLMLGTTGDLMLINYPGSVVWNYPRLSAVEFISADLVGDSTPDIFLRSKEGTDTYNSVDEGQTRHMIVLDGDTFETAWTYEMPLALFSDTGGLNEIQVGPDVNGDGKSDIFGYLQYPGDWGSGDTYGDMSQIWVFDGKSGTLILNTSATDKTYYSTYDDLLNNPAQLNITILNELYAQQGVTAGDVYGWDDEVRVRFLSNINNQLEEKRRQVLEQKDNKRIRKRIQSIDLTSDRSGDGIRDIIVGSVSDVFIIDSVTGEQVWTKTYSEHNAQDPFDNSVPAGAVWNWTTDDRLGYISVGDANGDGVDDLVSSSWKGITILHSNLTNYMPVHTFTTQEGMDENTIRSVGDVNGNGIEDILIRLNSQEGANTYHVLEGKNGGIILSVEEQGTLFDFGVADFDGDGSQDTTNPKDSVISVKDPRGI